MMPVGLAITLAGYTLMYFGIESLRGPGVGLLDLIVPGRFQGGANASGVPAGSAGPSTLQPSPEPVKATPPTPASAGRGRIS